MRLAAAVLALALLAASPARAKDDSLDTLTAGFLIGGAAALVAYDVYLVRTEHKTVSAVVRDASWQANVIPYAAGVLAGHFFCPLRSGRDHGEWALATVPIVVGYDILLRGSGRPIFRHPAIPFAAGFAVGVLTWSGKW